MATTTNNMGLRKPDTTDTVDVTADISGNFQTVDDMALMNRHDKAIASPEVSWSSSGVLMMNCNVKADRLTIARSIMPIGTVAEKWYRLYTLDLTSSRANYRIEFDNIRSANITNHGLYIGFMATASELSGYSSAPTVLPVKISRSGSRIEVWAQAKGHAGEGTTIWMGNVLSQYGSYITPYETGDVAVFGDDVGPVVNGPTFDDAGATYSTVVDLTQRGRRTWYR